VAPERRISIVEDDDSLRLALVGLIRSIGHSARGYESAEHFLANGAAAASDCVITDIHMPGLSGIEMTERLRAGGHHMPVIMITARSDPGIEERAMASGAACFLRKPFEMEQLLGCLDDALSQDGARAHDSL
jgi:FixJ family two-component response regulator